MKLTNVQWTDYSTNPVVFHDDEGTRHWHCEKVSAGCTKIEYKKWNERTGWPLPNVWLGTSVESADVLAPRVAELRSTPASKLFLSCEPLLGPLHGLAEWLNGIDWVIVGGESGPHARPNDIAWHRSLRDQCQAAGVPYFEKQLGSKPYEFGAYEPLALDIGSDEPVKPGRGFVPEIIRLKDRHGGNMAEWPEDLRVREFPRSDMAADAS